MAMTAGVVRVSNSLLPAGSLDGNASSGAFGTSSSLRGMVVDILCEREVILYFTLSEVTFYSDDDDTAK